MDNASSSLSPATVTCTAKLSELIQAEKTWLQV